jgi:peptidoglycan/xylan/chitin deacetylase (PgdA/CDA1 family)
MRVPASKDCTELSHFTRESLLGECMAVAVVKNIAGRGLMHLLYHTFTAAPTPHITPLFDCKSPEDLERDLAYLKSRFHFVSHDEIVAHRERGRRLPPRAVAITFDDGFVECFTLARPLLLAHGIPASFFVCKNFIDNKALMFRNKIALCVSRLADAAPSELTRFNRRLQERFALRSDSHTDIQSWLFGLDFAHLDIIDAACECLGIDISAFLRNHHPYMDQNQIAQLHADGFTIGAHTNDHPELGKLSDWNEVRRQIEESCAVVRAITGRSRVPFAFPFNGLDLPRAALAALRDELGTIDLMYDTNDLMKDRSFIVNRICCDSPEGSTSERSNLPRLLRRAQVLEPLRAFRRSMCRLSNRGDRSTHLLALTTRRCPARG